MAVERKVIARKGQHLVAVPVGIRKHLGTAPGVVVYWRASRRGEATIARKERPARGPERPSECASCAAYAKELERLRQRVAARDLTLYGEGHSAGYLAAYEHLTNPHGRAATEARALHAGWKSKRPSRRARRARKSAAEAPPDHANVKCWTCGRPYAAHREADHAWHASPLSGSPDAPPSPPPPPSPARPITCPACGALMLDDERCPTCGSSGGDAASGGEATQAAHE